MPNTRRRSGQSDLQENGDSSSATDAVAAAATNRPGTPEPTTKNGLPDDSAPGTATPSTAKKPIKKRKLNDSPPWKSATTQTPTSFIGDDGRRKSGRTNIVPKELLPPGYVPRQNETPARRPEVPTSASRTARTPAVSSANKRLKGKQSSTSRSASRPSSSSARSARTPPLRKVVSRSRNAQQTPSRSAKGRRSPTAGTRKSARALQRAVAEAEEQLAHGDGFYSNDSSELSSYVTDEEDEEAIVDGAESATGRVPKVKLKFGMPRPVVTHPSQIPLPKPFASFEEFLMHDDISNNPEALAKAEEEAKAEAAIRNRIAKEAKDGLLTAENCSLFMPEKKPEPPQQYSHHDHLVAHALNFYNLLRKERREHQELMRKRNAAVMAEIRRRRPRTREEIEQEQYIENRKLFKEQIAQLKRKWEEVVKEVEKRRIAREEEERRIRGKQELHKMLERSTALLDARTRTDRQGSLVGSEMDLDTADDEAEDDVEEPEDEDAQQDPADENISESSEPDDADDEDEDANLTVEQLRAKYAAIATTTREKTDDDEMSLDSADSEESDADMEDTRPEPTESEVPELEEVDPALLDDSDESIDMDSGGESGSFNSDESDDESDENGEEDNGLLGFYGGLDGLTADDAAAQEEDMENDFEEEEDEDDTIDLVGVPKPPPKVVELEDEEPPPEDGVPNRVTGEEGEEKKEVEEKAEAVKVAEKVVEEVAGRKDGREMVPPTAPEPIPAPVSELTPAPQYMDVDTPSVNEAPGTAPTETTEVPQFKREESGFKEMVEQLGPSADASVPAGEKMEVEPSPEKNPVPKPEADAKAPKSAEETSVVVGKPESVDTESATSTAMVETKETPKDTGAHTSPTTTPGETPAPEAPEIKTPVPFLLRGTLRQYQHYGLDWLAGLYDNKTNGILADEMGLGKTIQTIALLAHLACEKAVWGPHLIVVPTSVMLNWEMEFKKWAPGFKILTYYGSKEQRAEKRKGWLGTNNWHVCITSYQIVLADQVTFKRRNWHHLILDEAHNIKNFRSQRWQTLLNFKSEARLLLTGTPLQNNLVELWSLLYFLMPTGSTSLPSGFANLQEFQEWFAHPVDQIIDGGREGMDDEAKRTVTKLHKVLRPYLLRRLKADVEKQMPAKYEHVVYCRLSKRQRYLYDDFMSMAKTRETLASGNYLSIINCLMQLRKVCNHPDLFETRQIVTSFAMQKSAIADYETTELLVRKKLFERDAFKPQFGDTSLLEFVGLVPARHNHLTTQHADRIQVLSATELINELYKERAGQLEPAEPDFSTIAGNQKYAAYKAELSALDTLQNCMRLNRIRTRYRPLISSDLIEVCSRDISVGPVKPEPRDRKLLSEWHLSRSDLIASLLPTLSQRAAEQQTNIIKFGCITPAVVAPDMASLALTPRGVSLVHTLRDRLPEDPFHEPRIRLSIAFPDKRLLQYDCGKLQRLDLLLRQLQAGGHRALIFTQMTKVLDILEQFLNIHGHRYLRLDGATKVEMRQQLTDRFNNDPRIPVFILSTRSGGLGINLTGADTVIFYDLDWNPAMDKQCQDRCHRIGQTRDVHIYRFVSEYTIESNILRKSEQKRMLDDIVIQEGEFTTDYFNKLSIRDMLGDELVEELAEEGRGVELDDAPILGKAGKRIEETLEQVEDGEDVRAAKVAQKEVVETDVADFEEGRKEGRRERGKREESAPAPTPRSRADSVATAMVETPMEGAPTPAATEGVTEGEGEGEEEEDEEEEEEEEKEPEHVDEYMIRFIEWELKDVPVVIPDKSRRRRNKKGKKF